MRLISIPASSGILDTHSPSAVFPVRSARLSKFRVGRKDVYQGKTIAPNRGSSRKPIGSFVRVEVINDLRLVLGLPVHVRENLDGSHFGSVPLEAKDRNDRYDNYEKYWNEVSH